MLKQLRIHALILLTPFIFLHQSAISSTAADPKVEISKKEYSAEVYVNGELFTAYNTNPEVRKPYLFPVYAEGKKSVVRDIDWTVKAEDKNKKYDHVHHKGIWISIDEVNKNKHWVEKQLVVNKSLNVESTNTQHTAVLTAVNEWLADDKTPLLEETTRMTFHPDRVIDFEIKLTALAPEVEIEDTKEGFFAVRLPDDLREQNGGMIINSNGGKTEKECWGQQASWVDYSGKRGDDTLGIAIFDAPTNPHPARYHVRAYGLFAANPYGDKAYTEKSKDPQPDHPLHLKKGESQTLKYAIYIHTGDTQTAHVAEEYKAYSERVKSMAKINTKLPVPEVMNSSIINTSTSLVNSSDCNCAPAAAPCVTSCLTQPPCSAIHTLCKPHQRKHAIKRCCR